MSPVSGPQRIRLFKSERLEKLTLISPRTFALSWGGMFPAIAAVGWVNACPLAAPAYTLELIVAGVIAWVLFESAMHRYLFHLRSERPWVAQFVFLMHGNHHASPNDRMRGLMPLPVSVSAGALIWAVCLALIGAAGTWLLLGFMAGYVFYDTIHFACHHWPMRGRLGSVFKRHHMRHHHIDEGGNYAISAIFLDRLFRSRIISLNR